MAAKIEPLPAQHIETAIVLVRGQKVLLDRDLAALYGVETRALNQAVRRNAARFPADFMFKLSRQEIEGISQSVISSSALSDHEVDKNASPREIGFHAVPSASKDISQRAKKKQS
jgi:hypothetical protein